MKTKETHFIYISFLESLLASSEKFAKITLIFVSKNFTKKDVFAAKETLPTVYYAGSTLSGHANFGLGMGPFHGFTSHPQEHSLMGHEFPYPASMMEVMMEAMMEEIARPFADVSRKKRSPAEDLFS